MHAASPFFDTYVFNHILLLCLVFMICYFYQLLQVHLCCRITVTGLALPPQPLHIFISSFNNIATYNFQDVLLTEVP